MYDPHVNHKLKNCNSYTKKQRRAHKYNTRENHQTRRDKSEKEKDYKTTRKQVI